MDARIKSGHDAWGKRLGTAMRCALHQFHFIAACFEAPFGRTSA